MEIQSASEAKKAEHVKEGWANAMNRAEHRILIISSHGRASLEGDGAALEGGGGPVRRVVLWVANCCVLSYTHNR